MAQTHIHKPSSALLPRCCHHIVHYPGGCSIIQCATIVTANFNANNISLVATIQQYWRAAVAAAAAIYVVPGGSAVFKRHTMPHNVSLPNGVAHVTIWHTALPQLLLPLPLLTVLCWLSCCCCCLSHCTWWQCYPQEASHAHVARCGRPVHSPSRHTAHSRRNPAAAAPPPAHAPW